jgi:hypothetical protein
MGSMQVLDRTGDTKVIWDKNNPDEVENARRTFDELKAKGFLAYSVKGRDGEKGELLRTFDPDAERLIMSPPLVGG